MILAVALLVCTPRQAPAVEGGDAFERLKTLAGDWEADLPGFGKIKNVIRVISNGRAIEETIGTDDNNEASIYTRDGGRILLTHFCAMTEDGHQVRLRSGAPGGTAELLQFDFQEATNLHSVSAPHMRKVSLQFADQDHFSERWTKTERGRETVFELKFVRVSASPQRQEPAIAEQPRRDQ